MKKIILLFSVVVLVLVLVGADIRRNDSSNVAAQAAPKKKRCVGFTIIEFGKGVDCNGDTVALKRVNGVQVLASTSF
jgi:hypothetical protein